MTRCDVRATVRLALWTAGLVVALRLLVAAGSSSLSVPLASFDGLSAWVAETPPADMTVALLRLAALAATGYLLAVTVLAVVARLVRIRPLATAVDRISPGVVRRIVTGGSGVGLVLGGVVASLPTRDLTDAPSRDAVASAPAGAAGTPSPSMATMARLPEAAATMTLITHATPTAADAAATDATMAHLGQPPAPSATMTRMDEVPTTSPDAASYAAGATPAGREPEGAAPPTPALPGIDPTTWVVEPGDSLWSIAEEVMASPDGTSPGERAVVRYWHRLVEANRAHLVDPDNADLLVPGQRLVVPPPAG